MSFFVSNSNEYTLSRSGTWISEAELVQMDLTMAPPLGFEQKLDGTAREGEDFTAAVAEVEDCSTVVREEPIVAFAVPDSGLE